MKKKKKYLENYIKMVDAMKNNDVLKVGYNLYQYTGIGAHRGEYKVFHHFATYVKVFQVRVDRISPDITLEELSKLDFTVLPHTIQVSEEDLRILSLCEKLREEEQNDILRI